MSEHEAPRSLTRQDVLNLLKNGHNVPGKDYLLIDLRRMDFEGGYIRGSINLPAQSLRPSIPALYTMFKQAGVSKVIWYCGSSGGRGPRAAARLSDYLLEWGDGDMESLVMAEGIKGWVVAGGEFLEWMDEYGPAAWVADGPK